MPQVPGMDVPPQEGVVLVGVVSDTHGQVHPRVKEALTSVDHIVHAGDIGGADVLAQLRAIAPVTAVRGNCDLGAWAADLPERAEVELGGAHIVVAHLPMRLKREVQAESVAVVVSGHSHVPSLEAVDGVLYLNPGSAGPRRLGRPRTVARIEISPAHEPGLPKAGGPPQAGPSGAAVSWVAVSRVAVSRIAGPLVTAYILAVDD